MNPVAERFAENLWRSRQRAGLSQEELGFAADLHRTEVGLLECGRRLPRIDTLVKLASALNVAPEVLLEGIAWNAARIESGGFGVAVSAGPGGASDV